MKKITISIILIFLILVYCSSTFAANSAKITLNTKNSEAKQEDTICINLKVNGNGTGISGVQGKLNYDKNVLEYVSSKAILDGWFVSGYNPDTGIFLVEVSNMADTNSYIKDTKELVSFYFKVKKTAKLGDTTVKISELVASGASSLETKETTQNITIVSSTTDKDEKPGTTDKDEKPNTTDKDKDDKPGTTDKDKDDKPDGNTTNKDQNTNKTPSTNSDNSVNKEKLPDTGKNYIIQFGIILTAIVGIVLYKKSCKYRGIK